MASDIANGKMSPTLVFSGLVIGMFGFLIALQWQNALTLTLKEINEKYPNGIPPVGEAFISACAVTLVSFVFVLVIVSIVNGIRKRHWHVPPVTRV